MRLTAVLLVLLAVLAAIVRLWPAVGDDVSAEPEQTVATQSRDDETNHTVTPLHVLPAIDASRASSHEDNKISSRSVANATVYGERNIIEDLIADGSIRQVKGLEFLHGDDYHRLYAALRAQVVHPEASMRNARYMSFFANQEEFLDGRLAYKGLECGASICLLEVAVHDAEAWEAFKDRTLGLNRSFPVYAVLDVNVLRNPHEEHRLLFSIDPAINAFTFPPAP